MEKSENRNPLPPQQRSLAAQGLRFAAIQERFALQVCEECSTVQYPPRDICGKCLSDQLVWNDVDNHGVLVAATITRVTGDPYFKEMLPWRTGIVKLDCGPSVIAHLHGDCNPDDRVRLVIELDEADQGAMFAMPAADLPDRLDDRQLKTFRHGPDEWEAARITLQQVAGNIEQPADIWPGLHFDNQGE
ncbi:OB-fold domain-containing protein [Rhizobium sp. KVB221]|uniref:OB-fold domain-containing protein n=1 Tax=Rhizobium setariae TaxID=2801340 RepID=A0A936YMV6_9HYPH|nr:OB-fold domain-containing protein [Rhizobium setariae]MBL0373360.1 OB-fold domain-containing protein [Rhizobium setariae]